MDPITDVARAQETLARICERSHDLVFLGGAGVSTASGIPDFRSEDGLYHQHFDYPPETILSHDFFETHPEDFWRFYRERMIALWARPNQAHERLADLEATGPLKAVLTQNIDGLHQDAGSRNVLELHGSVRRNRCLHCGAVMDAEWVESTLGVPPCPHCGGRVKPEVVLYGEPLDQGVLQGAVEAIAAADTLIIGGTSLVVWPVAGLVDYFRGDTLCIVNLQPTPQDAVADVLIQVDIARAFGFPWPVG